MCLQVYDIFTICRVVTVSESDLSICVRVCVCMYVCMCAYIYVCVLVSRSQICVYVCVRVYVCMCVCVHMCVCMLVSRRQFGDF